MKYTRYESITIASKMITYGGSFVKALGECINRADHRNLAKLQIAFPEYFDTYFKF